MNYVDLDVDFGEYFVLPNLGLSSYFGRVRRGYDKEIRTRFFNPKLPTSKVQKKTLSEILDDWIQHLEPLKAKWPGMYEFEMDLAKKVGPMSIMLPLDKRMKDIDSYYESILLDSKPISRKAIDLVCEEWSQVRPLRIRSQKETVELMKKSTSSGSPFYDKKRDVVTDTVPCTIYRTSRNGFEDVVQVLPRGKWCACAILGWRGQEGGPEADDVKQRVVFMFPFSVNVRELQFYQVLIERAQALNLVPAWVSMEAVDQRITRLFDTKRPRDRIVCTDFTKFDQHFNPVMQDAARQVFNYLLVHDRDSSNWLESVFPIKYNIPLAYDFGKIRYGAHGMGSGSGGTNADETVAHRALQYEAALRHRKMLNPNSMCLGDDGILTYPGITAKDVTDSYTEHGLEMNLSKQSESEVECTYLRRYHHRDYRQDGVCVGVYSTCRALGRLAEQERYYDADVWGPKMVALRQLSILENVKYHPLREEFVDYCMQGDAYRLGVDIPGFLDNIDQEAKKAKALMPDLLGYTRSEMSNEAGIGSWWVVNYLKGKK